MSRWPSEDHFSSWMTLAPNNKISGGRLLSSRTPPSANRAAVIKCYKVSSPHRSGNSPWQVRLVEDQVGVGGAKARRGDVAILDHGVLRAGAALPSLCHCAGRLVYRLDNRISWDDV